METHCPKSIMIHFIYVEMHYQVQDKLIGYALWIYIGIYKCMLNELLGLHTCCEHVYVYLQLYF